LCAHVCSYISKFNTCFTLADLFVLHDIYIQDQCKNILVYRFRKKNECNMLILDFFSIRFMFHSLEKTVSVQLNR
jgi:hypothetical protein